MPEEKEDRRCDLCEYETIGPCRYTMCNSTNGLSFFKPKDTDSPETGCDTCAHWKAVKIGKFCPDCGQGLG